MNSYLISFSNPLLRAGSPGPGGGGAMAPDTDFLSDKKAVSDVIEAFTLGSILSHNFDVIDNGKFRFDLPFALTNENINKGDSYQLKALCYDTRFRSTREFLDKPYAVAGRVVSFLVLREPLATAINEGGEATSFLPAYGGDYEKDLDQFVRYELEFIGKDVRSAKGELVTGILNSTLTESYAPLSIVNGVLPEGMHGAKFYEPADFVLALRANASDVRNSVTASGLSRQQIRNIAVQTNTISQGFAHSI